MIDSLRTINIRRLLKWAEFDRAVLFGVLTSLRGFFLGPISAILIVRHFTPQIQGYYYTFASLLALQMFAELGLSQVIIQFASHEWAQFSLDHDRRLVASPEALSRFVGLGRVAFLWYAVVGFLVALFLSVAGIVFFSNSPSPGINWTIPWVVLCVLTGIKLWFVPSLSILEGCNQVSSIYAFRFIDGLLSSIALWLAIALGAGLWTPSIATSVSIVSTFVYLVARYPRLFRPFMDFQIRSSFNWKMEVWPLQWRVALTWLSGYFSYSLFTPVLFHYYGPVMAGQMGMTWSVVGAISTIATMWVRSKAPYLGLLVAKRDYKMLDRQFFRSSVASFIIVLLLAILFFTTLYFLQSMHHRIATRMLPLLPTGLFLLAIVIIQIPSAQAIYLRAHKKEPLVGSSMIGSLLISFFVWILGKYYGAVGIAAGFLGVNLMFWTPVTIITWYRCRRAWHG